MLTGITVSMEDQWNRGLSWPVGPFLSDREIPLFFVDKCVGKQCHRSYRKDRGETLFHV